jgi:hypothetical protein
LPIAPRSQQSAFGIIFGMPRSKGVNRTTGDLIDGSRRRAKAAAGSNLDIRIEVNDRSEIVAKHEFALQWPQCLCC